MQEEARAVEQRLGRGLDSLITRTVRQDEPASGPALVPLSAIRVNPQQPRRHMDEEALAGLAASIAQHGILQPVVVRRLGTGYELVAGERRFRASRIAGLQEIPVVVVEAEGARSLELALIENIQRENISALDEAEAYRRLLDQTGSTHQELASQLGKSRAAVSNSIRLLDLPDEVQGLLESKELSAGQARAILGSGDRSRMIDLAREAATEGLSVREVERRVRSKRPAGEKRRPTRKTGRSKDDFYIDKLMNIYDTKVTIVPDGKGGDVRFTYHSMEDRDRLMHILLVGPASGNDGHVA